MNVLDLFSGIGGLSLAAEQAGMTVVAHVEIDPFCRRVLAKHWPAVRCYEDVRDITAARLREDGIPWPALIAGGFPCQDISAAGKGAGIEHGERSGLWREFARIIGDLRPRYVVVENVAALLHRGLDRICGDLATLGYDATWATYGADAVGAPHRRERVFIVAHTLSTGRHGREDTRRHLTDWVDGGWHEAAGEPEPCCQDAVADADAGRWDGWAGQQRAGRRAEPADAGSGVGQADPDHPGRPQHRQPEPTGTQHAAAERSSADGRGDMADAHGEPLGRLAEPRTQRGEREPQPGVCRDAHGLPRGVDGRGLDGWPGWPARPGEEQCSYEVPRLATGVKQRVAKLRALGNAVVPLQALPVFTAIMQAEQQLQEALHMQAEQEGGR